MKKKIATNSMIGTAKRCRRKFVLRYVRGLVPATMSRAPGFGSLFHLLYQSAWLGKDETDGIAIAQQWREEHIVHAQKHAEQVQATLGFTDGGIVESTEAKCDEISESARALMSYYREAHLPAQLERYEPIFSEVRFSVPLSTRDDRRHPVWRFDGKWDLVLRDLEYGRVIIRDLKTTIRSPADFATTLELDTQGIGYLYAGRWLAAARREGQGGDDRDFPVWPKALPSPKGFELEIVRKKVPKEPPPLKRGGLSKAQNIDTTPELYRRAIKRHGLDEADYSDVLQRIEAKGDRAWRYASESNIGAAEIARWAEETRYCLEDARRLELHPERAYRADPMTCQNMYGRRCEYHALCFGDEELALTDFVTERVHNELEDDNA